MFGVGLANVTAMLLLGGVTAIEKNLPSGRRLTHPLGVFLVLAAVYSVAA
jgi:predicted metal-binding membrane protein